MSSPEQAPTNPERGIETPRVSAEHYERLENGEANENLELESAEKRTERAKAEALEAAVSVEKSGAEKDKKPSTAAPRRRGAISKKEKAVSYKKHLDQVQAELPAGKRAFSKVIHQPAVEKVSEALGATIMRPNAVLSGAVVAFFAVLAVYLIARYYGYVLSGFESIAAFIVGWGIGLLYDYFKVMITGKKS